MVIGSDPAASGGGYIHVPEGTGVSTSPTEEAIYSIDIPQEGDYYLWLLMNGPTGGNDALYIGFDGSFDRIYPIQIGQYEWIRVETVHNSGDFLHHLTAGQHQVNIGHGEELARADRILVTNDPDLDPSQITHHRADTSPRDGCISMGELLDFIELWKGDSSAYPMGELMGAVSMWKGQEGCN